MVSGASFPWSIAVRLVCVCVDARVGGVGIVRHQPLTTRHDPGVSATHWHGDVDV